MQRPRSNWIFTGCPCGFAQIFCFVFSDTVRKEPAAGGFEGRVVLDERFDVPIRARSGFH